MKKFCLVLALVLVSFSVFAFANRAEDNEYSVFLGGGETVEGLIEEGNYDAVRPEVNNLNFVSPDKTGEVNFELVNLGMSVSSVNVLDYIETNRLRPATLVELLAFGSKYPDIQFEFEVVALGSYWIDGFGRILIPFLDSDGLRRRVLLYSALDNWFEDSRFLVVRE